LKILVVKNSLKVCASLCNRWQEI